MAEAADVLVGDANGERVGVLNEILQQDFGLNSLCVETFDEIKVEFEGHDWKLVFMAEDLPVSRSDQAKLKAHLTGAFINPVFQLNYLYERKAGSRICCLVNDPNFSGFSELHFSPQYPHVPLPRPSAKERAKIIIDIERASGLRRAPKPPDIIWDQSNYSLHRQLCLLSDSYELDDGVEILSRLVRDCVDCDKATVGQLAQGLSGASVFYLRTQKRGEPVGEYVLKLADNRGLWKITSEIKGHEKATNVLKVKTYRRNIAQLLLPRRPHSKQEELIYTVSSGRWYAICYDYLGSENLGKALRFLSLETALVAPADQLWNETNGSPYGFVSPNKAKVRQARLDLTETILTWLCTHLYKRPVKRKENWIWNTADSPTDKYVPWPPYQLTARSKGWIMDFLDSNNAHVGQHLLPDWQIYRDSLLKLVRPIPEERKKLGKLGKKQKCILSPAHGDLNVNNILLWLDEKDHPFLIDFPFYQDAGHALQDLARLEVEIKFALMDRQEHDEVPHPLPALDHSASQLLLWQELEDHFLSDQWDPDQDATKTWQAHGFKENVELCFDLVSLIRRRAWEVQQQLPAGAPAFHDEYFPALLFHTIQAIGYPSLSIFKRLLAVQSAGRLLSLMGC